MGVPCGMKFLRKFIFAYWAFFSVSRKLILRLGVVKQEYSVIVRWRDFIPNPDFLDFPFCRSIGKSEKGFETDCP